MAGVGNGKACSGWICKLFSISSQVCFVPCGVVAAALPPCNGNVLIIATTAYAGQSVYMFWAAWKVPPLRGPRHLPKLSYHQE